MKDSITRYIEVTGLASPNGGEMRKEMASKVQILGIAYAIKIKHAIDERAEPVISRDNLAALSNLRPYPGRRRKHQRRSWEYEAVELVCVLEFEQAMVELRERLRGHISAAKEPLCSQPLICGQLRGRAKEEELILRLV
mgnify:FL=1